MDIYLLGVYCHKNRIQELKLQHADAEFRIQNSEWHLNTYIYVITF